jgi:3-dehydroquinate synthase
MKTVEVSTGNKYNIVIGDGLLKDSGRMIREVTSAKTAAIVTDSVVDPLYSDTVRNSLEANGFETVKLVFPNGEKSKNINTYSDMLEFMAENRLTRSDCIVALGGGVVGDIAGFCAATYLRGISFVQIPTTLLACVDSSVGGKTAIDLKAGKNLAGAFYQPKLVICDYSTLSTLSDEIFADGMAETIKYGALFDGDFLNFLNENNARDNLEYIIEKCVTFKRDVVNVDETDRGVRGLLNFGHTIGHAIEKCSDFAVPHGSAVAIGMVLMSRGAYKSGITKADITEFLVSLLKKYKLPVSTDFSADELFCITLSDKKRSGDDITLVIPSEFGKCEFYKTQINSLKDIIEKGLN